MAFGPLGVKNPKNVSQPSNQSLNNLKNKMDK
jgi:hypothetical protein